MISLPHLVLNVIAAGSLQMGRLSDTAESRLRTSCRHSRRTRGSVYGSPVRPTAVTRAYKWSSWDCFSAASFLSC